MIEAVLRCMGTLDHPFESIRVYTPTPIPADVQLPPIATSVVVPSRFGPALWEQFTLPRAHGRRGLLLCPSYVSPLFAGCPTFQRLWHAQSAGAAPDAVPEADEVLVPDDGRDDA